MAALADAVGDRATLGKPLGPLTTYGVGGPAAFFVEIEGRDDLAEVRLAWREALASCPPPAVFVLGRGSNLLVADEGFDGVVVHLGSGFAGIDLPPPGGHAHGAGAVGAGGSGGGPAGARPPGGRRRMVRTVMGGRGAGLGRRRGAHERGGPRIGHGVVRRPLQLGRSFQ